MKNLIYNQWGIWDFYKEKNRIYGLNLKSSEKFIVSENNCVSYDITVNNYGVIYGIVQENNDILIFRYNGKWEKEYIMKDNEAEIYNKKLSLINIENWLNAFYIIKYEGKNLLFHHILGTDKKPQVIFASKDDITYLVNTDVQNNVYVFISVKNIIICKKFIWKNKEYQKDTLKKEYDGDIINLFGLIHNENIHITCCTKFNDKYKIYTDDILVMENITKELKPLLTFHENLLCIFDYYGKLLESRNDENTLKYLHTKGFNENKIIKVSGITDFKNNKNFYYTYGNITNSKVNLVYESENSVNEIKIVNKVKNVEVFAEENKINYETKPQNINDEILILLNKLIDNLAESTDLIEKIKKRL